MITGIPQCQARINGLYDTLLTIAPGLGFAAGGLLAALAGPRSAYLIVGAGTLAVLTWAVASLRPADWSMRCDDDALCSADGGPRTVIPVAA